MVENGLRLTGSFGAGAIQEQEFANVLRPAHQVVISTEFRAIIREVFIVAGRGCVIALDNDLSGETRVGQVFKVGSRTVSVAAVEVISTSSDAWVARVVGEEHFAVAKADVGNEIVEHP